MTRPVPTPRSRAWLAIALAGACVSEDLPPSIWPPPNFELVVEELRFEDRFAHVAKRLRVTADGVAVYGTSSRPLVDPATGTSLPVFDRLSVYRLEPDCVRALARRIDRLGISEIQVGADEAGGGDGAGVVLTWQAFDERRVLPGQGRLRGAFGEILAVVAAHLPPGETFAATGDRSVVPVLRGVPEPATDTAGALGVYRELVAAADRDPALVLDAFALACATGDRGLAEEWLARWTELTEAERANASAFPDGAPRLGPGLLTGFLPSE